MLVPSCIKISPWFSELLREHDFHTEIYKGHNSVKTVNGVTVLILCILSDDALYLYQVL